MSYTFAPKINRRSSRSVSNSLSTNYSPTTDNSTREDRTFITSSRYSPRRRDVRVSDRTNITDFSPRQVFDYSPTYYSSDRQVYRPRSILKLDEVYAPSFTDDYTYRPQPVIIDHRDMWHYLAVRQRAVRDIILASLL